MVAWDFESSSDAITINHNNSDPNDIEAEDIEDEVDYLRELHYYSEEEDEEFGMLNTTGPQQDNTQGDDTQLTEDNDTQLSQNLITQEPVVISSHAQNVINQEPDTVSRSHAQNVINEAPDTDRRSHAQKDLTFISDNASDIIKALKGRYQWLGCAAHHTNLVNKEGFKK